MDFDADSKFLATCIRDKQVFVWHNICGLRLALEELRVDHSKASKDTVKAVRIQAQIDDVSAKLAVFDHRAVAP